ncbi:MAG TPA: amino acid adenylation domain-containing protein [Herpetosiphonaceae bacterium]
MISGFQLSPQQAHLWMLQQADQNQRYRAWVAVLIEGNLDQDLLKAALANVVARHEILRTTFRYLPGMTVPLQVIGEPAPPALDQHDLSDLGPHEQAETIARVTQESGRLPFDVEHGPLLRASLLKKSPEEHLLLLNLSALCADAVTLEKLVAEIGRSYAACAQGEELVDEAIQYADIAGWLNEVLESEDGQAGRDYWRALDHSALSSIKLPGEGHAAEAGEFAPRLLRVPIDPEVAAQLAALAQQHDTPVSTCLLAGWQTLLWRLIGQQDIIVGTRYDGRSQEELQDVPGLLAKYLPLHGRLEEDLRFAELVQRVKTSVHEAGEWQDYFSWEQARELSGKDPALSFFPICFDFESQSAPYSYAGLAFSIDQRYACFDRFKLKLVCVEQDRGLSAELHYDASVFSVEEIQRLAGQFQTLLASVVQREDATLGTLDLLSADERRRLLVELNSTRADYPKDRCIDELFEEQAAHTPDAIAVVFEDRRLTYAELNTRANQLAHHLRELGVRPETLVALCVERSPEMVIGILGILKAGGAYVPIDPAYPAERQSYILADTRAPVLLTQQHLIERLPEHTAQVIAIDAESTPIAQTPGENPARQVQAANPAYVIYTSGSTGTPKGVLVAHQNLVHSTSARIAYYHEPVTKFLLLSSFAFDSSIAGIFWTLCQGGALCLPQPGLERDVAQIAVQIAGLQISHLLSLPSLFGQLLAQAQPQQLQSLRTVIVAGEACPPELIARHNEALPRGTIFNEYGPTEGTVWSSVYRAEGSHTPVPIGRPIANMQIYLLDRHMQPVPIGVVGELHIGGDGLARGYLNRPDLTAERFVPDPFGEVPGGRLYRTGDLARYLSSGDLEFIGRIDQQVKVRGYRIELGEIEAVLARHATVREAVVVVREDVPGDQRLVAYVTEEQRNKGTKEQENLEPRTQNLEPRENRSFPAPAATEAEASRGLGQGLGVRASSESLRSFLQDRLPEYMIPSAFVVLPALPLTPNGKVDRRALPAPDTSRTLLDTTFVAPRTPLEENLAAIWAEVLHLERVGVYDNFSVLGGHSLLATQLISRVRETFEVELPLRSLFEAEQSTIAGMVERIETMRWAAQGTRERSSASEEDRETGEV